MNEKGKPSLLIKPDGTPASEKPKEEEETFVPIRIPDSNVSMGVMHNSQIFYLSIPLKKFTWNQIKVILGEAFSMLTIRAYEISKLENKRPSLSDGVKNYVTQGVNKIMGRA